MKQCAYCGRDNDDNAVVCRECGVSDFQGVHIPPPVPAPVSQAGPIISRWLIPIAVGAAAWLLVFGLVVHFTLSMPKFFLGIARMKLTLRQPAVSSTPERNLPAVSTRDFIRAECGVIQSERVLGKVIDEMNLEVAWGQRYFEGHQLKTVEALKLLRGFIEVRPVGNTSLIEIQVFSPQPEEAAQIANAVAKAYRDNTFEPGRQPDNAVVEIVNSAVPAQRPARPEIMINIASALLCACLVGVIAGALAAGFRWSRFARA